MFNAISSGVQVDPETGDATFHLDSADGEIFEFTMSQDAIEGALLESVKFAMKEKNLPVRAAKYRALNADLILECVQMGYLKHEWKTVDLTYGDGKWWTKWEPDDFVKHDKFKGDGVDYTCLPEADETYDVVAYDPTYVNPGGKETSTIKDMHQAYGMDTTPGTLGDLLDQNRIGMMEAARVLKKGGFLLAKTTNYIESGKMQMCAHDTYEWAKEAGLVVETMFIHMGNVRAQPSVRGKDKLPSVQKHPRNNYSILYVFQKPRK